MELIPEVFRAIKRKGYNVPTPIQRKAIPVALQGHDIVAMARTVGRRCKQRPQLESTPRISKL